MQQIKIQELHPKKPSFEEQELFEIAVTSFSSPVNDTVMTLDWSLSDQVLVHFACLSQL
jgi:hypothetical protein